MWTFTHRVPIENPSISIGSKPQSQSLFLFLPYIANALCSPPEEKKCLRQDAFCACTQDNTPTQTFLLAHKTPRKPFTVPVKPVPTPALYISAAGTPWLTWFFICRCSWGAVYLRQEPWERWFWPGICRETHTSFKIQRRASANEVSGAAGRHPQ